MITVIIDGLLDTPIAEFVDNIKRIRADRVFVDCGGPGKVYYETLRILYGIPCEPLPKPDAYLNALSEQLDNQQQHFMNRHKIFCRGESCSICNNTEIVVCERCNNFKREGFDVDKCRKSEKTCSHCIGTTWMYIVDKTYSLDDIPTEALGREIFKRVSL